MKFVPVTVSVWAGSPAVAELGERLMMVGTGFVPLHTLTGELKLRGTGFATTVKSFELSLVSVHPLPLRIAPVEVDSAATGAVSEALALP